MSHCFLRNELMLQPAATRISAAQNRLQIAVPIPPVPPVTNATRCPPISTLADRIHVKGQNPRQASPKPLCSNNRRGPAGTRPRIPVHDRSADETQWQTRYSTGGAAPSCGTLCAPVKLESFMTASSSLPETRTPILRPKDVTISSAT